MRRSLRHLVTLVPALPVVLCVAGGCEVLSVPVTSAIVASDVEASNGEFELSGQVVDADGTPLREVTMTIETSKYLGFDFDPPGGGGGIETKKRTRRSVHRIPDGTFQVKTGRFSDLSLYFAKAGYDSRTLSFAVDPHATPEHQSAGDREYFRGRAPLRLSKIRVVLPAYSTAK